MAPGRCWCGNRCCARGSTAGSAWNRSLRPSGVTRGRDEIERTVPDPETRNVVPFAAEAIRKAPVDLNEGIAHDSKRLRELATAYEALTVGGRDGKTRYRFVVDVGRDPATGKRTQLTRTCDTLREARAERARMISETSRGTFVRPRKLTLDQYLDEWVDGATRNVRPATRRSYTDALTPARARVGRLRLQDITKADVERSSRGWRRAAVSVADDRYRSRARSIQLTLGRLTAALETALQEGLVVRNVAKLSAHSAPSRLASGSPQAGGTRTAGTSSLTSSAVRCIPSGTPTSSAACRNGPA
jgi:hypothetical protein